MNKGYRKQDTFTQWNITPLFKKNDITKFADKWMQLEIRIC